MGVALHCAVNHRTVSGVISDDLYTVCNTVWTADLPGSVGLSTVTVYSDDRLSQNCSNPCKLYTINIKFTYS